MSVFPVNAQLSPPATYYVSVRVNIPWTVYPFVRLAPHQIQSFVGTFDREANERFMEASRRIIAESAAIVDAARYGWRLLTDDELRRLDELDLEHEIAIATLQRTLATSN